MTTINADAAFLVGHGHAICQDYAFVGTSEQTCVALLSDGCSGSPDTDIGARLLARAAWAQQPRPTFSVHDMEPWIQRTVDAAQAAANGIDLSPLCLDATLLGVHADEVLWRALVCGDGLVAVGRENGVVDVYAVHFGRNCPAYPAYRLSEERRITLNILEGNARTVETL